MSKNTSAQLIVTATTTFLVGVSLALNTLGKMTIATTKDNNATKDIIIEVTHLKNQGRITDLQISKASKIAVECNDEIMRAIKAVQENDKVKVLHHIINAKGYLEAIKKLGIPMQKYADDIRQVEKMWSQL